MKKLLLLLFAFVSFTSAYAYDFAAENEDGKTIYYNIALVSGEDVSLAVTYKDENYNSYSGEIKIPEEVDYNGKKAKVITINSNTFKDCSDLTIVLPNTITDLYQKSFNEIRGNCSITFPDNMTVLRSSMFGECKDLTSITINGNLETLEYATFLGCSSLKSVALPVSVKYMHDGVFQNCSSLESIALPDQLQEIGACAFFGCSSLTSITIPENVIRIGDRAFEGCNNLQSIRVLSTTCPNIEWSTFSNYNITVYIREELIMNYKTNYSWRRFSSFKNLNGEDIVEPIESDLAIENAEGKTIYYNLTNNGETLQVTYRNSAYNSYSGSISIPEEVTYEGITRKVTSIGTRAFGECLNLSSIKIPSTVTSVGQYAFQDCDSLQKVIIEDIAAWCSMTFGSDDANPIYYAGHIYSDENTEISDLVIPEGVKIIRSRVFQDCKSTISVILPSSIQTIQNYAFRYNSNLTTLTLPEGLRTIREAAFEDCISLKKVVIPSTLRKIENGVFRDCEELVSVTIPEGVVAIGEDAFQGCENLPDITLPNSITSIGEYAFSGCSSLTSITIPDSVTSISDYTFRGCSSLSSITIPNAVTSIGEYAFSECGSLCSVFLPSSVTSIGENAFSYSEKISIIKSKIENPCSLSSECFTEEVFANATLYVPVGSLDKYKSTDYWNKFTNIIEETITPQTKSGEVTISEEVNENTSLDNTVIDNVYYNITNDNGHFDPTEQCLTISQPTDDSNAAGEAGSKSEAFTGMIIQVPGGTGKVTVKAQTTGSMTLKVRVGEGDPEENTLNNVETVTIPYNVTESSNIYIYAGSSASASAKSFGKLLVNESNEGNTNNLKIYGVSWEIETIISGVKAIEQQGGKTLKYYDLQGRSVQNLGNGVYIVNGKKVLIRSTKP